MASRSMNPDHFYRSEAKSGTSPFHAYATLYILRNGYRFTVALTPVSRGEPLAAVLKHLLLQAAQVGIRCRSLLFVRGLYTVGVNRFLLACPPSDPDACELPRPPARRSARTERDQRLLDLAEQRLWDYTMHDAQKRPARVAICVKFRYYRGQWRQHGKQHLIYAFSGLQPPSSP